MGWNHEIGVDSTIVRTVTTPKITLTQVSYKDLGKCVCTVGCFAYGESGLERKLTSSVSLSLNGKKLSNNHLRMFFKQFFFKRMTVTTSIYLLTLGPPYIPMPPQIVVANPGDILTLSLSLISFPASHNFVLVRNGNNEIIHRSSVFFTPTKTTLLGFWKDPHTLRLHISIAYTKHYKKVV